MRSELHNSRNMAEALSVRVTHHVADVELLLLDILEHTVGVFVLDFAARRIEINRGINDHLQRRAAFSGKSSNRFSMRLNERKLQPAVHQQPATKIAVTAHVAGKGKRACTIENNGWICSDSACRQPKQAQGRLWFQQGASKPQTAMREPVPHLTNSVDCQQQK